VKVNSEPSLEKIEDYCGNETKEKRMTIHIVILTGLVLGSLFTIVKLNNPVTQEDRLNADRSGIFKY